MGLQPTVGPRTFCWCPEVRAATYAFHSHAHTPWGHGPGQRHSSYMLSVTHSDARGVPTTCQATCGPLHWFQNALPLGGGNVQRAHWSCHNYWEQGPGMLNGFQFPEQSDSIKNCPPQTQLRMPTARPGPQP